MAEKSVVYEYRLQHDCPECAFPIILNGPWLSVECRTCGAKVHLGAAFWKGLFREDPKKGFFVQGKRMGNPVGKKRGPFCARCNHLLDVEAVSLNASGSVPCAHCDATTLAFPAPKWMRALSSPEGKRARTVFGADLEESSGDESQQDSGDLKPIAFHCINCSSPLEFNLETPRIMECSYCGTQQYLPPALWQALHPVAKKRSWYVQFS